MVITIFHSQIIAFIKWILEIDNNYPTTTTTTTITTTTLLA